MATARNITSQGDTTSGTTSRAKTDDDIGLDKNAGKSTTEEQLPVKTEIELLLHPFSY